MKKFLRSNSKQIWRQCENRMRHQTLLNASYRCFSSSLQYSGSKTRKQIYLNYRRIAQSNFQITRGLSTSNYPDHEVVGMPALSPTMETGNIAKWNKKEGELISPGDIICEVETDKATVDYEAQDEGYLAKILVPEGASDISVGQPIFVIVENEDDVGAFNGFTFDEGSQNVPTPQEASPVENNPVEVSPLPTSASAPSSTSISSRIEAEDRLFASPFAKKLSREAGIKLPMVDGSGPNGRIIGDDIRLYLASEESQTPAVETETPVATSPEHISGDYTDVMLSEQSIALAEQLTKQKHEVPHYHLTSDICIDELLNVRKQLNSVRGEDEQLSVYDFLVRAAALSMKQVPDANSAWMGTFIREYHNVNINVMMSHDSNAVVNPVLHEVQNLGLHAISQGLSNCMSKVKSGEFTSADTANGTFTISNVGSFGVKSLSSIVSPNQSCSLGLGTIERRVVPNDDPDAEQIYKYATMFSATLACDHRVIDGAVGAKWLAVFKDLVENPLNMLL